MYPIFRLGSRTRVKPDFAPSLIFCAVILISSCGGGGSSRANNPPPEPALSLSTTSLSFGTQTLGTTSAAQSVTLTNTGNAMLSITSIAANGDFSATNLCGDGIAAGRNCTLSVTFTPSASGPRSGSVTIIDNATGAPHTISLTGTGEVATVSIQLSSSMLIATQDGQPSSVGVTVTRLLGNTNFVTLSVGGFPAGVMSTITSPGTGDTGSVAFNAQNAAAGTYAITVDATDGATTATAQLTFVVAIVSTVQNSVNTSAGINGRLQQFMSTSFQPAEWDFDFFVRNPGATATLTNLNPQHIRLQGLSEAIPMKSNSSPCSVRRTTARNFRLPPPPVSWTTPAGIWTLPTT